jgi:hypothetical protein
MTQQQIQDTPLSGSLFAVKPGVKGLVVSLFAG